MRDGEGRVDARDDCDVTSLLRAACYEARRRAELSAAWRVHGIGGAHAAAWITNGVFEPQRAALLIAAGIAPGELDGLTTSEGFPLGYAFVVHRVSLGEVVERVARRRLEQQP